MHDQDRDGFGARADEARVDGTREKGLPWTAPDIQTLDLSDTALATPRNPGTDGSFSLS